MNNVEVNVFVLEMFCLYRGLLCSIWNMLFGGEEFGIYCCCIGRVGVYLVGVVIVGVLRECKGRKWIVRVEILIVWLEFGEFIIVVVVRGRILGGVW